MAAVNAQIVIALELDELSVSGTRLDLNGISLVIRAHLDSLGIVEGGQVKVLEVSSPTKDWQIAAQLRNSDDPLVYLSEEYRR